MTSLELLIQQSVEEVDDEVERIALFIIKLWELLLGNVVISKNFLRTRKIMVMHSNERGECCPRTLVEQKRKR